MTDVTHLLKDMAKLEHDNSIACQGCSLSRLCLPLGLHYEDLAQLDKIIKHRQSLNRGETLFTTKYAFKSLYVVRSGSFKTTISASNDRDQITGFYFPGEFIGLDALYRASYQSDAQALETSSVCELSFDTLQEVGKEMPQLQIQLLSRLSKELSDDKSFMLLLGKKTVDEKLATFLTSFSKRFSDRGFSATEFQLTMSRSDIANHLGIAAETVSRVLSRFQAEELITILGRKIILRDSVKIKELCG